MTETQAKSGTAGASTDPVDSEAAADGGTPATGRAVVGRATVPAPDGSNPASTPKYTRAPGMIPPPDEPVAGSDGGSPTTGRPATVTGSAAVTSPASVGTATVPHAGGITGLKMPPVSAPPMSVPVVGGMPGVAPPGIARAPGRPGVAGRSAVGAARVTAAVKAARSTVSSAAARGPRRARLNVKRIDPWSVMKFSFAVSLVLFIVVIVATSVLYLALDAMGVFDQVNQTLGDMVGATGGQTTEGGFKITAKGVIGTSALLGAVNVVLFTALATLAAFIYNVCADLVGGVEVTLAERD